MSLASVALRRVFQVPPRPQLPPGFELELPGRGTTFVAEVPGPPGAPTLMLLHGLACTGYLNWFPSLAALSGRHHPDRVEGLVLCATARNFRGTPYERLFFLLTPAIVGAMALRRSDKASEVVARTFTELPRDAPLGDLDVPQWALAEFRSTSPW